MVLVFLEEVKVAEHSQIISETRYRIYKEIQTLSNRKIYILMCGHVLASAFLKKHFPNCF